MRCWPPIRIWKSIACRPSGTKPCCAGAIDYVMGATLPGCPLFAVARTERLAWGVTYLKGDTSDYFIEDCRRGGATGWQYRRGDGLARFRRPRGDDPPQVGPRRNAPRLFQSARHAWTSTPSRPATGFIFRPPGPAAIPAAAGRSPPGCKWSPAPTWPRAMEIARRLPAADAVLGLRRPRGAYRPARRTAGFPSGARHQRPVADSGLGRSAIIGAAGFRRNCCRESTIRRKVSSPRPTKTSTRRGGPQLVTLPVPDYRKRRIDERLAEIAARPRWPTCSGCNTTWSACRPAAAGDLLAALCPTAECKQRLAAWDCSYSRRQPGSDAVLAALSQRAAGDFRRAPNPQGGGIGWRRMLYLSQPRRLFDDGAHRDRPAAGEGAIALVARPRQRPN